ncbi:hypothetical protein GGH92_002549 [Coemansia sp. RSA 2673]|nr:hypothetical protein GGH92_002549 [Coemansia sp. RSA 2673]
MDLPNDQQQPPPQLLDLTQERWGLKYWRNMLLKEQKSLESPEDIQQWLQRWDKMKTKKKALQLCQQWIRELEEQKKQEAKLRRIQKGENRSCRVTVYTRAGVGMEAIGANTTTAETGHVRAQISGA